jgi:aspartyl-tRNA(Asn)/glutamyl-tRNA(Gln) amidotransferase subunit A
VSEQSSQDSTSRYWPTLDKMSKDVVSGSTSALANVEKALARIKEVDPEYNAIIALCENRARKRARLIDDNIANAKDVGRLAGIPFIAKDNFLVFGAETTAASNILKGFEAPYQSSAIDRLEAAGAICVAKANLDAFAHGSSTENSDFFVTKNPYDKTRVPGGSSGGSAAAVALDMAPFALGTDTGGSIRLPASYCGVIGYKPTYGIISRSGVVAMGSSTDVIGTFTRRIEDAMILVDVMAGRDGLDSTLIERQKAYVTPAAELSGKRIGVIREYFGEGLDPGVKQCVEASIDKMRSAGAVIEYVSLPSLPLALAVYYVIVPAEVSSNLSRYDGQRYGYTFKEAKDLQESYELSRSIGFGSEAKRRIMIGTHVLSSGYYDAYYKKAQTVRTKIINEFAYALESYDFLVGPTAPNTAFKIAENTEDPLAMYLTDIMTVAVNLAGLPAINIPCGEVRGLPCGLQIIAKQSMDAELLALSQSVEGLWS